jgi:hypothetical protein
MAMPFWRPGEGAATGVVVCGGLVLLGHPDDDAQGDQDEQAEDGDVEGRVADLGRGGQARAVTGGCPFPCASASLAAAGSKDAVGPAGVDHRDRERRRELQQAEDQADGDVAEELVP